MNLEAEPGVFGLEEDGKPEERIELALQCLPDYNPGCIWNTDPTAPFRYWKIRDYAYAYRSKLTSPSQASSCFPCFRAVRLNVFVRISLLLNLCHR